MIKFAAAAFIAVLVPAAATWPSDAAAGSVLSLNDVKIAYQPEPARYQPQGTDLDLADQGKTFAIDCTITSDGHLSDCRAEPNNMADQNFIKVALDNVGEMVIVPQARDGDLLVGKTLTVTCQFKRQEGVAQQQADAAPVGAAGAS